MSFLVETLYDERGLRNDKSWELDFCHSVAPQLARTTKVVFVVMSHPPDAQNDESHFCHSVATPW